MNKPASLEWLTIAFHDFKSAQILYDANHYTDSIGGDLQQSIEKILKSIIAFKNEKIPKTHDLYEIYDLINEITFEEYEIKILEIATEYLKEDRYPNSNYSLPKREEIKEVLDFTEKLFEKVCNIVDINLSEVQV
ncbi:HEPN domain-containing protein [Sulfurimonas sp.]|uniref:HEPN domain-containing protein n=1 Tax=Sulfurimonas sp. TaxID=2022749 RepID=UPI002AB104E6|nr:HEPN domain-containing protein [Sulfurimonas sp.]